jgi:hypothetical protein
MSNHDFIRESPGFSRKGFLCSNPLPLGFNVISEREIKKTTDFSVADYVFAGRGFTQMCLLNPKRTSAVLRWPNQPA